DWLHGAFISVRRAPGPTGSCLPGWQSRPEGRDAHPQEVGRPVVLPLDDNPPGVLAPAVERLVGSLTGCCRLGGPSRLAWPNSPAPSSPGITFGPVAATK